METKHAQSKLIIDGRKAQGLRTGIGHYTRQILLNWPNQNAIVAFNSDSEQDAWSGPVRSWKPGATWHLRALATAIKERARYFSPESMFVPIALGKRAVITIHDLSPISHSATHTKWNVLLHKTLFRLAIRRVGKIIVPTDAIRNDLVRYEPSASSKVVTIYEGIRPHAASTEESPRSSAPYALYVGTIEPRKNVTELVRTFLQEAPGHWRFVIVGKIGWLSPSQLAEFEKVVASEARIEYLGYVEDRQLVDLYRNARSFFYVSASEGFGLPIAEAMSFGLPVVHTNDPALVEVGGGAGILVDLENFEHTLREAIRHVTSLTPSESSLIGERAREQAQKFDWRVAAKLTQSLTEGHQ